MSLRDHLQTIYDEHGQLSPSIVVEVARDAAHPLHSQVFDKPVSEAAEAYYLDRAHRLIQRVKVTRTDADGAPVTVRGFWAVTGPAGEVSPVYEPAERVATDPFMREFVLRQARRDIAALKDRYGHMQEFIEILNATFHPEQVAA